jgi:two-component system, response regulator PdtaR
MLLFLILILYFGGFMDMDCVKFILAGDDKKTLSSIKRLLIEEGNLFVGYSENRYDAIRLIRSRAPELAVIEVKNNLNEIKSLLNIIEDELLCACTIVLDSRSKENISYLKNTKVTNYIVKPLYRELVLQIMEFCLINYNRVIDYEEKLKKLNNSIESKRIVDKAKWILIERNNMTEVEAYEVIKKKSRDNRMPMRSIAEAIILTRCC